MDRIHDILHSLINHLVPHDGNDYRPHLLQRGAMLMMLMLVFLSFLATNFQALLWQSSDWLVGAILPAVVVDLTNTKRTDLALPNLVRNPVLDKAASLKAQDMADNSYFSHDSPTGVTPWHWFSEANYPFVHAGENLAVYFNDSSEVVEAWMNSPTHRANIVGSQYREIGVGTARGTYDGFETVFVVQMFGTPAVANPVVVEAPVSALLPAVAVSTAGTTTASTSAIATAPVAPLAVGNATNTASETVAIAEARPLVAGDTSDTPEVDTLAIGDQPVVAVQNNNAEMTGAEVALQETASVGNETVTESVSVDNEVISLYSGLAASSTALEPAPIIMTDDASEPLPKAAVLATEPSKLLQLIYLVLGGITALVLLLSVLLEWRHHRPVQTVYGLVLLLIMAGLFYVHTSIIVGAVIL